MIDFPHYKFTVLLEMLPRNLFHWLIIQMLQSKFCKDDRSHSALATSLYHLKLCTLEKGFSLLKIVYLKIQTQVLYIASCSRFYDWSWTGQGSSLWRNRGFPCWNFVKYTLIRSHHIYASELRSRSGCGRPRVGVGGLWMLSSCRTPETTRMTWANQQIFCSKMNITVNLTCIHVSSTVRSGDVSGDWRGGGKGWISFGTTTSPLPTTSIAPALFAVPESIWQIRQQMLLV